MSVLIETTEGDLVIDLLTKECPKSCSNFLALCRAKYYHFSRIDHVIRNKLCYTGHQYVSSEYDNYGRIIKDAKRSEKGLKDTCAWGLTSSTRDEGEPKKINTSQPNQYFVPELQNPPITAEKPERSFRFIGTVAWVPQGESSNIDGNENKNGALFADSKFCISLADDPDKRFADYDLELPIFGHIVEGQQDTLKKINESLLDNDGEPKTPILILHTHILEDPFEDETSEEHKYWIEGINNDGSESPKPDHKVVEILNDVESLKKELEKGEQDEDDQEKEERLKREREAAASAITLELVGDLPSADVLPDSHVLFVCKLNSITNSEDLELIFSRFGEIRSCEVIRDSVSGESLQYAFIEFEKKQDCERAYLKMEGAIIDDRRIHVDFSQSVSNLMGKWRGAKGIKRDENGKNSGYRKDRDGRGHSKKREDTRDSRDFRSYRDRDRGRDRDRDRDVEREKRRDRDQDHSSRDYRSRDDDRHRGRSYDRDYRKDRDRDYRKDRDYEQDRESKRRSRVRDDHHDNSSKRDKHRDYASRDSRHRSERS